MRSSFQAFLISEFKSGLFNYLEPWTRPVDAFDPLSNAYIYRGTLNKRKGFTIFGRISYRDNNIALGSGITHYTGTLTTKPIVAGSFASTDGVETFTDNGDGTLTGSAGGTGTINYTTGAWVLDFNVAVAANTNIRATYNPNVGRPIMGIKTWTSEATGSKTLVVMDTRRMAKYNNTTNQFEPVDSISQPIWVGDGATASITLGTGWVAVAPYANALAPFSISITDGTSTITDNGAGALTAAGNFAAGGTVNYATGSILLNFTVAPGDTVTITLTAKLVGDYFSGTNSNFFNAINWLDPTYYSTKNGQLYMTNNANRITLFNGTTISRPPFPTTAAKYITFTNDIATCLDIDVFKNRITIQLPSIVGGVTASNQSIRWSKLNNPTNLIADVTGNGGELSAPTDDFMESSEFLRDQLVVFFSNSTWLFRFTGSDFAPFRWDKINATKSTSAPYGTIDYDERVTAMGSKGLIACDGVNVQRYDTAIIDQFSDINQNRFFQCYGLRFDTLNQSWMLYPNGKDNSTLSNKALIYNFIENTWSIYNLELSCLGLYYVTSDKTWNDFGPASSQPLSWNQAEFTWNSYLLQELAPTLLGGSESGGYVYQMNDGDSDEAPTQVQELIDTGTGVVAYSGTLSSFPIVVGTFAPTDGVETFTDNGDGTLTGSAGGSGTINYLTGAWSLTFNVAVIDGREINATYTSITVRAAIESSITSARWNPFTNIGEKVQFGYIDVYYQINAECVLDLTFYIDNSLASATTRQLTLDGPVNSDVSWKRVYINIVGEFLRMNISNNQEASFKILGMVLWASPSGRLTPGRSVT